MTGHKGYASFKHKPWLHALGKFLKIVIPSVPAKLPHLLQRLLQKASFPHMELPRHGKGMLPSGVYRRIGVIRIRNPHPAYENAPPLFIQKGLRRIEVKSPVHHSRQLGFQLAGIFPEIIVQAENRTLMHILILCSHWLHALRAADQTELSVQTEQIRAFPHIAKGFVRSDSIKILPFF